VKRARTWTHVLDHIDQWASAREVPGGIEITFEQAPGVRRRVEVVVTAEDWEDYLSVIWGSWDPRVTPFKDTVLAMPVETYYLVYDTYDWIPSRTRDLPDEELPSGPGEWVV